MAISSPLMEDLEAMAAMEDTVDLVDTLLIKTMAMDTDEDR